MSSSEAREETVFSLKTKELLVVGRITRSLLSYGEKSKTNAKQDEDILNFIFFSVVLCYESKGSLLTSVEAILSLTKLKL